MPNCRADLRQGVAVEYVFCEPTEGTRELFDEGCGAEEEKTGAGKNLLRVHRGTVIS